MIKPAEFLAEIGIQKSSHDRVSSPEYWKLIRDAGGNPQDLDTYGPFSPQAGNVFFCTEEVARRSLSGEYNWFLTFLRMLEDTLEKLPTPRRIADIGGGIGIPTLYLARLYPDCCFTVYDHAPRQLEIGRQWAKEYGIENVKFVETSYQELAEVDQHADNDVVLFMRGMNLRIPNPRTGDTALKVRDCRHIRPKPSQLVEDVVQAMFRLMSPKGIGIVHIPWSGWGLINVFEACRNAGLCVDWTQCQTDFEVVDGTFQYCTDLLAVRRGMPDLGKDSYEDAQGFLSYRCFRGEGKPVDGEELESYYSDFADAELILSVEGISPDDGAQRVQLLQKEGVLLFVAFLEDDYWTGEVFSLTGIDDALELTQTYLDDWKNGGEIKTIKIEDPLRSFIDLLSAVWDEATS